MSVSGQDVGGILNNGGNTITPGITTGAVGLPMPAAAWATIPAVPTLSPTCSGNGVATLNPSTGSNNVSGTPQSVTVGTGTGTLTPGNYSSITVQGGTLTFGAGTYCISGLKYKQWNPDIRCGNLPAQRQYQHEWRHVKRPKRSKLIWSWAAIASIKMAAMSPLAIPISKCILRWRLGHERHGQYPEHYQASLLFKRIKQYDCQRCEIL